MISAEYTYEAPTTHDKTIYRSGTTASRGKVNVRVRNLACERGPGWDRTSVVQPQGRYLPSHCSSSFRLEHLPEAIQESACSTCEWSVVQKHHQTLNRGQFQTVARRATWDGGHIAGTRGKQGTRGTRDTRGTRGTPGTSDTSGMSGGTPSTPSTPSTPTNYSCD